MGRLFLPKFIFQILLSLALLSISGCLEFEKKSDEGAPSSPPHVSAPPQAREPVPPQFESIEPLEGDLAVAEIPEEELRFAVKATSSANDQSSLSYEWVIKKNGERIRALKDLSSIGLFSVILPTEFESNAKYELSCVVRSASGGERSVRWNLHFQQRAVYVSDEGNNTNSGTIEKPLRTISSALAVAQRLKLSQVRVAVGIYQEDELHMREGISLLGGYNPKNLWRRDLEVNSVLHIGRLGVSFTGIHFSTEFRGFEVFAEDAKKPGQSSYAVRIIDSSNVSISQTTLHAGKGADGENGKAGLDGNDGLPGKDGMSATATEPGSAGKSVSNHCGTASISGAGGNGGKSNSDGRSGNASTEASPLFVAQGGKGGEKASKKQNAQPGQTGQFGRRGMDGQPGAAGSELGIFQNGEWIALYGSDGTKGEAGTSGGGGGGGGSGLKQEKEDALELDGELFGKNGPGGGGGSGGTGGCGGDQGAGAQGGGASIGILVVNSSKISVDGSYIHTSKAGAGGSGGAGGKGGNGGQGGRGGMGYIDGASGGLGGSGGGGGTGGWGGPGAGGANIGIAQSHSSEITVQNTDFKLSFPGSGGQGAEPGPQGIHSEVFEF